MVEAKFLKQGQKHELSAVDVILYITKDELYINKDVLLHKIKGVLLNKIKDISLYNIKDVWYVTSDLFYLKSDPLLHEIYCMNLSFIIFN